MALTHYYTGLLKQTSDIFCMDSLSLTEFSKLMGPVSVIATFIILALGIFKLTKYAVNYYQLHYEDNGHNVKVQTALW